jgi:integrase
VAISKTDIAKALKTAKAHHMGGGIYLDVRSATSASWAFKFTFGGKGDQVGLGSLKKVDGDAVEALRLWCLAELAADRNPRETRALDKLTLVRAANAPKGATVYELARDNVSLIAKKLRNARGRDAWVRSLHSDVIGYVADMDPAKVTKEDVEPLLRRLYQTKPVYADDIRQRLAKLLSWAKATGRITAPGWENPVKWEDNLEHTLNRGDHETKNHEALPAFRVGKFVAALRKREENALAMRLGLEWHIISATRPGEAAALDWSWFDWANDCVTYPAEVMKMRRAHRAPLTTRHHEILDLILAGREPPTSGPVFAIYKGAHVSVTGLRKVMQAVQPKGCTLHGFRSSFATWARAEAYPVTLPTGEVRRVRLFDEALIEECLAHMVGGEVRNAYVRDDFLELRRPVLEAWATYCGKVQGAEVLPMRRRTAVAA